MKKEYKNNVAKKGDKKLNVQELDNVAGGCDPLTPEDEKAIRNQQFKDRYACELFSYKKGNTIYGKVRICGNCKNEELRDDGVEVCKFGR